MRSSFFQLHHPLIGQLNGRAAAAAAADGDIAQFFGIKYASVDNVFAPSKLVEYSGREVVDATELGPMVLGPKAWDNEFGFIQKALPMPEMSFSGLEGLNLNITVPLVNGQVPPSASEKKRPVFVFVHGGGFQLGANSWPQYDHARIVRLSIELGMPVVCVGINYRVGLPGFLTSDELRDAGVLSNNGIRDQVNAFRWVKKYISGFGGDPENVTFIGESAGSVAGSLLLHQKEPLFKRYISMSGTSLLLRPLPAPVAEFVYANITERLGLGELSAAERVKALTELPADKIVEASAFGLPLLPVVDGETIPCIPTFAQLGDKSEEAQTALSMPGRTWCTDLFIGDCQFDGSILGFMLGDRTTGIASSFCTSIQKSLAAQPTAAQTLQDAYHLTPSLDDPTALRRVLQFATDIGFCAPTVTWARGWPGTAHIYHFNEGNPWDGPWKGEAGHVLDVAFLFQNYNELHLDPPQQAVARAFAADLIAFMNGALKAEAFTEGRQEIIVYGSSGEGTKEEEASRRVCGVASKGSGRSDTIFKLAETVGFEELSGAWNDFLAGK